MPHPSKRLLWIGGGLGSAIAIGGLSLLLAPTWRPPLDRDTLWAPGVQGGVPYRTAICATVAPAASVATLQAAIDSCPQGQVVQLSAGQYTVNSILRIATGVTVRGAGLDAAGRHLTVLKKTNGAVVGTYVPIIADPVVIMGASRWASPGTSANLVSDATKGAYSVTVAAGAYSVGQVVLLDELSGAGWRTDPQGRGQVWASADFSVVWQRHLPSQGTDDPFPDAAGWFSRPDRPQSESHQIASVSGATLTFTTPLHKAFRVAQAAQIFTYPATDKHVRGAGLEDVRIEGGGDGNVRIQGCVECWVARTENTAWLGEGVAINRCFRCEVRDSYVHDGVWSVPGGGGYALSIGEGSSEVLIENNVIRKANKVMVFRSAGAGSVVAYNYADDGFIQGETWAEIGLNASHMVGPHHVLFEGNYGWNFDSDKTHGNSTFMTVFRNHLSGKRASFTGGPQRAAAAAAYGYNMTYAGNVLGTPGMTGWAYESGNFDTAAIWLFGWDDWPPYPNDPGVKASALREANFDYVSNSVRSDSATPPALPDSLYLGGKPAFFGSATWPWVDAIGAAKLYVLPAKARYDSGRPNVAAPGVGPTPTPPPNPTATVIPTATLVPTATATLVPTVTPMATATVAPTATVMPTVTPSPVPTPTPVSCVLGEQRAMAWPATDVFAQNALLVQQEALGFRLLVATSTSRAVFQRVVCR